MRHSGKVQLQRIDAAMQRFVQLQCCASTQQLSASPIVPPAGLFRALPLLTCTAVAAAGADPARSYSPEQLYEVVAQVQHYHQFVPWCVGSNVLRRSPDNSYLEAELQIGFQMISER